MDPVTRLQTHDCAFRQQNEGDNPFGGLLLKLSAERSIPVSGSGIRVADLKFFTVLSTTTVENFATPAQQYYGGRA
jgi:hypothetical protein